MFAGNRRIMQGMLGDDDDDVSTPTITYITDTFNGAAGSISGRATDTGGGTWTNNLGTANVNGSGSAVNSTVAGRAYSIVNSGLTTYTARADIIGDGVAAYCGLLFRFQDANNFRALCLSGLDLYLITLDAGVESTVFLTTLASTTNVLTAEVTPTSFDVKVNGGASLITGGAAFGSATKQGIFLGGSIVNQITYFEVQ